MNMPMCNHMYVSGRFYYYAFFANSQFHNNSATRGSADSTALTAYRVLLTFNGNSSFVDNFGGGISLLGSRMDVQGEVILDGNIAVFGAGIAMTGRSLVSTGLQTNKYGFVVWCAIFSATIHSTISNLLPMWSSGLLLTFIN